LRTWPTIVGHLLTGVAVGVVFLHPITMAIYWFEGQPAVAGVASAWEFALSRVTHALTPAMLPMTATFAVVGAILGLGSGLYAVGLRRRERHLARLAAELAADVRELIRAGEGERLELKASARWDHRKGAGNRDLEAVVARSIAGFINADGGTLLLGVGDDGGEHGQALTTTRASGPPAEVGTAWTSYGVRGRGGGPPMFLPVRSKMPLWQ